MQVILYVVAGQRFLGQFFDNVVKKHHRIGCVTSVATVELGLDYGIAGGTRVPQVDQASPLAHAQPHLRMETSNE